MLNFKKILLSLICTFSLLSLVSCAKNEIVIKKEAVSPNGKYIAYAHNGMGGMTLSFTPGVYLIESSYSEEERMEKLNKERTNIYDTMRSDSDKIDIEWIDDETLKVIYPNKDEDIYLKVDIYNGIKIQYQPIY